MSQLHRRLYECGPFVLDPLNRLLSRNGSPLPLPPKAFETLLVLVEHRGDLVEKEQLMKAVWPDTFIEENNLTQYISLLRRTLGDTADQRQYIETVPRLGYRFVAPVREIVGAERLESGPTRIKEQVGVVAAESAGPKFNAPPGRARWIQIGFAVISLFAIAWVLYYPSSRSGSVQALSPVGKRRAVAVLGFRNIGADPENDWLSTALLEVLDTELSAGSRLRAISGEEVAHAKRDLKIPNDNILSQNTLRNIRRMLGADITVSGSYLEVGSGSGKKIRLDIQLQDTSTGDSVGSIAEDGNASDLLQLINRCGVQLRSKLGVNGASSSNEDEVRASLSVDPETLRFYSQGLVRLWEFDAPAAQKLFMRAVAIDPSFALGHSALAAALSVLGYDEKAQSEAKQAFDFSEYLPREQRLLIVGQYHEASHEWDKAVEAYQSLFTMFPDNIEYGLRLVNAQISAGKNGEAQGTVAQLRRLPNPLHDDPRIDLAAADVSESVGQFNDELESAERAASKAEVLGEGLFVARALVNKAWAASRLGDSKNALAILSRAGELFTKSGDLQGAASAQRSMAIVLIGSGEYARAGQAAREALDVFKQVGDKRGTAQCLNTLATISYEQGMLVQSKALYEQYLEIEREVGSKVNVAGALGNIANILEAEGDLANAQKLTEDSIQVFSEVGDKRALGTALGNLAGLIYEQGDLVRAKQTYEEATKIKRTIGYQRGVAYDLDGLSQVADAEGNLVEASKFEEEALSIRNAIGEKHNAATSLLGLAGLALEDGNAAQAQIWAMQGAQILNAEKSPSDEALGDLTLARCFAAQSKVADAQDALKRASSLSHNSVNRPLRFELAIATAEVLLAGQMRNAGSVNDVQKMLLTALQEARRCGYRGYGLRLQLASDELEARGGKPAPARSALTELQQESKKMGFGLISHKAEALLASTASHP